MINIETKIKFEDFINDVKLLVVEYDTDCEHEKVADSDWLNGPWYIVHYAYSDHYTIYNGILNYDLKQPHITLTDRSKDENSMITYMGNILANKTRLSCPKCGNITALEDNIYLADGTTEIIYHCIECEFEFIPLGEL